MGRFTRASVVISSRAGDHRDGRIPGFTQKYGCKLLVWYERHADINEAIKRETRIKGWKRAWKIALIEERDPQWRDLYEDFLRPPPPTFLDP